MGKTAVAIDLTPSERRELESLALRRKTAQGLAGPMGASFCTRQKARRTRTSACGWALSPNTVGKWRRRFAYPQFLPVSQLATCFG